MDIAEESNQEPAKTEIRVPRFVIIFSFAVLIIAAIIVIIVDLFQPVRDNPYITSTTAIFYDSKVHISWTIKGFSSFYVIITYNGTQLGIVDSRTTFFTVSGDCAFPGSTFSISVLGTSHLIVPVCEVKSMETGIPTLVINTLDSVPIETKEDKIKITFDLYDVNPQSEYNLHITDYTTTIKGRGNTSWGWPKKGYSISFSKKQSLLGLPKHKKWCIIGNYRDKTLLRNSFSSWLGKDVFNSVWSPSYVHVDVILNNEYIGNYIIAETIRIDKNRVDIQDISEVETDENGDGIVDINDGGFIMEVNFFLDEDFCFVSDKGVPFCLKRPDEVAEEIQQHTQQLVQRIETSLYSDKYLDESEGYKQYIDLPSWIDWYLVQEFTKNLDGGFQTSDYMYYNPTNGLMYMGPLWDFDGACGCVTEFNIDSPLGFYVSMPHPGRECTWYTRMLTDRHFVEQMAARWNEKKEDVYRLIHTTIQQHADRLKRSADLNFNRWPILGTQITDAPPGYEERSTYQSEIDWLINWLDTRYKWFDQAINSL